MAAKAFYDRILRDSLAKANAITGIDPDLKADRFILAIGLQESNCQHRFQIGSSNSSPGPARGFYQFERGGGVRGVMTHGASRDKADALCQDCLVSRDEHCVWRALEGNDVLAAGFARLLIWTSPNPLPTTEQEAWTQYSKELWRPGKPHPDTWPANWEAAGMAVLQ